MEAKNANELDKNNRLSDDDLDAVGGGMLQSTKQTRGADPVAALRQANAQATFSTNDTQQNR
ncbi:hypothetical protein [Butyrivibrio sp. AC2005]|uniref:hypothetical protein n=1 Tax=Butyrivibrio sp. AC2005 TaxID=1280672 RepID=UPI000401B171|nr:hypothetical protein [Butyrivibrio sp. AC2005]